MESISFFTPIIYGTQNKTISKRILETVDEYFYLGNKPRVIVLAPDSKHSQFRSVKYLVDRSRSWANIAIKVASYCTLIFPLIALLAKAILRWHLQISSIKLETHPLPSSEMETQLPTEIVQHIGSFLNYKDQGSLAQVGLFARNAARETDQYLIQKTASLKEEITALSVNQILTPEDFQRLLKGLVTSPAIGHPKYWAPLMSALLERYWPNISINHGMFPAGAHTEIAALLAKFKPALSPDQIYQFCSYLGKSYLSKLNCWIGYRALEQYSLKLNETSVNKALKEYLTQQAKTFITAENAYHFLPNRQELNFQEADIDPRIWFGSIHNESSIWAQPGAQNDQIAPMPEIFLEVLWTHIQSLRILCADRPFMVSMMGRAEAELPFNSTFELAQRVTNAHIFLDHNMTIDTQNIEGAEYARSLRTLSAEEREALAAQYPNAVTRRRFP